MMQDLVVKYGFLEHDDYQEYFKTFNITLGMAFIMPFAMYSFGLLFIIAFTVVYKGMLGYVAFNLFQWLPEGLHFMRKYVYGILGLIFMVIIGVGYFMNMYYLFLVASIILYWSIMFKYGQVSKPIR
jgi:hypothetical protein